MLPKFLQSSHKRYKADTETFTTWLAEAAEKCGVDDTSSIASDGTAGTKYKVRLKQMKVWARAIAKSKMKVPPSVLAAGRRAVNLRTRCSDWFATKMGGGKNKATSDVGHAHFIQAIEEMLATLEWEEAPVKSGVQPGRQTTKSGSTTSITDTSDAQSLNNRFTGLEVEDYDTDGGTEPAPSPATVKKSKKPSRTYDVQDEDDEAEEKFFVIFCLFEDLERIRAFLSQTWKDYAAGTIDLMSASLTTNTALDLVREQCEEFVRRYPDQDGMFGATQTMWFMASHASGRGINHVERPGDGFDYGLIDVATWCLLPTYQLLDAFTRVLSPNNTPVYNGQYGWFDPKAVWNKMSVREKYNEDRAFLMQHLSEFAFLGDFKLPLPVMDELTRGVIEMCKTKKPPIWLAFAAQIFLDIKNILRDQLGKGFSDLRMAGLATKKSIIDHFKFHESWPKQHERNWAKQNDGIMREVKEMIECFIENDWYLSSLRETINKAGLPEEEYAMFKAHPLLCGVLIFHFNVRMQELGLILMNAWGTGTYAAYMYNAINQDALDMNVHWADMDKLIELHTEEHLFLGPRPTNHEDSFKKICLTTGFDPSAFSGGRKFPSHAKVDPKKTRGLEEPSVISKVYRGRYCHRETIDLSTKNVEAVLNDLANKKSAASSGSKRMRKKFKAQQKLTPLQLLAALQERLIDEEQSLKFNYLGMNTRVMQLFKLVKTAINPQMMSKFGSDCLTDEREISSVVHYMLTYASLAIQGQRALGLKPTAGMKFSSKCVVAAGGVLKEFVKKNGDVAIKELNIFCVNKPKLDTVARARDREEKAMTFFSLDELVREAARGGSAGGMERHASNAPESWKPGFTGFNVNHLQR